MSRTHVTFIAAATLFAAGAVNAREIFTIDPPNALFALALGANSVGQVTGMYVDTQGAQRAFLWDRGRFTSFTAVGGTYIQPAAINSRGSVGGTYLDPDGNTHGFLRDQTGAFTKIDPPGSVFTAVRGIDDDGNLVGFFTDAKQKVHGFLLKHGTTSYIVLDVHNALATHCMGINNNGEIVGFFADADQKVHGFHREATGQYKTIDASPATLTQVTGIDNSGNMIGFFLDPKGSMRAFMRTTTRVPGIGKITTVEPSNSVYSRPQGLLFGTGVVGAAMTGRDPNNPSRARTTGFLRQADGSYGTFAIKGAIETVISSGNENGWVVGHYRDSNYR